MFWWNLLLLRLGTSETRRRATGKLWDAWKLGKSKGNLAERALGAALLDNDRKVRETAALGLGQIRWQPSNNRQLAAYYVGLGHWTEAAEIGTVAIPFLLDEIKAEHPSSGAACALGVIGDALAVKPLLDSLMPALNSEKIDFLGAAVWTLGMLGDKRAVEPLVALLEDQRSDRYTVNASHVYYRGKLRLFIAEALSRLGDTRGKEILVKVYTDEEAWYRRSSAARTLYRLGWQPDGETARAEFVANCRQWDKAVLFGPIAVEPLAQVVLDPSSPPTVEDRENAIASLSQIHQHDPQSIEAMFRKRGISACSFWGYNLIKAIAKSYDGVRDPRRAGPLIRLMEYVRDVEYGPEMVREGEMARNSYQSSMHWMMDTLGEALEGITGKAFGRDLEKWLAWQKAQGANDLQEDLFS